MRDRFNYAYSNIHRPYGFWLFLFAGFGLFLLMLAVFLSFRTDSSTLSEQNGSRPTARAYPTSTPYVFSEPRYYFSLHLPASWAAQNYQQDALRPLIYAFGEPTELPARDFIPGNFVWIELFPVTDQRYAEYTRVRSLMGKDIYRKTDLGGYIAVDTGTYIATERSGYVYLVHIPYKKDRFDQFSYVPHYFEIVQSFGFTN